MPWLTGGGGSPGLAQSAAPNPPHAVSGEFGSHANTMPGKNVPARGGGKRTLPTCLDRSAGVALLQAPWLSSARRPHALSAPASAAASPFAAAALRARARAWKNFSPAVPSTNLSTSMGLR